MVSIPEPGVSQEYIGEVGLKLPKANVSGYAKMRLMPKESAFLIEAGIELPTPIPLAATGLAFYGFGGLLGFKYVAEKEAIGLVSGEDTWYDYYTYPQLGVNQEKFSGPPQTDDYNNPFAIGAGAVIGTMSDDGYLFSTRLMVILSLPSVFILDGRANLLDERLDMMGTTEPPFFAGVAIGDSSVEFWFGADYQLPKSNGWIIDLQAEVQAGFFKNNPSAWYVNFGTKTNPITARILSIITAQSYLMISAQGIEAGARTEFKLKKRFGPAKVHFHAYFEMGGHISFERPQIGGYIALGGTIDVDIWRVVGITINLDALLVVEVAEPFLIYAELRLKVCIKLLFRICRKFKVKLKWQKNNTINRYPIPALPNGSGPGSNTQDRREELVLGVHMLTNETFSLKSFGSNAPSNPNLIDKIIPLDTYIDIKVAKGLIPNALTNIGGVTNPPENYTDLIPPERVVRGGNEIRQVKHKYSIEEINIEFWNGTTWEEYHPFKAMIPFDKWPDVENLKIGYWQKSGKQYDAIRLLATTPFSYIEAGEPGWFIPEQYGITASSLFCETSAIDLDCSNVLNKEVGTIYYPPTQYTAHFINGAYYTLDGEFYTTVTINSDGTQDITVNENQFVITNESNPHGFTKSLQFNNRNSLIVLLPEPSVEIKLLLSTFSEGVTIAYYASEIIGSNQTEYTLIQSHYKTAQELQSEIIYNVVEDINVREVGKISKIVIKPDNNCEDIQHIRNQITTLNNEIYKDVEGSITTIKNQNQTEIDNLQNELDTLISNSKKTFELNTNSSECNRDDVLCALYDDILNIYNTCMPINPEIVIINENIGCIGSFIQLIKDFHAVNPEYGLLKTNLYVAILIKDCTSFFQSLINSSNSNQEILDYYNELRICINNLLIELNNMGDCDCQDPIDQFCSTSLQQICWLTVENYEYNLNIPGQDAIEEDFDLMTQALEKYAQPIWKPNTAYHLHFKLKDEVDNGTDEVDNGTDEGLFNYHYGFKTAGPIGHFHNANGVTYGEERDGNGKLVDPDRYPLTSLRQYIDYNRSYPNANGNLLKAKPLFYGNQQCKITLFFTKPYVTHMLNNWLAYNETGLPIIKGELNIQIKDPVSNVIIPYPLPIGFDETVPEPIDANWESDQDPLIPINLQLINNFIENVSENNDFTECHLDLGSPIVPNSPIYSVVLKNLKPQKLYSALIYNAFDSNENSELTENEIIKIHDFVFQTSRYKDFTEQVESYKLKELNGLNEVIEERDAIFEIPLDISVDNITTAYNIIAGNNDVNSDNLEVQFYHLFDRAVEGVLGFIPIDPPISTEFNLLKNQNTGKTIGILIRNPEPFNNPNIPVEEIQDTINVMINETTIDASYHVLFSKDYSQVLIMNNAKNISVQELLFRFQYKTWNGSNYIVGPEPENEVAVNIQINS